MTVKEQMYKKFENIDDLNLTTNLLIIQELTKKWIGKSNNEELQKLRSAIIQVSLLTNKLQLDRENYHITINEYRSEKLRMVERARRAEEKLQKVEEEVAQYKKKIQLGL